VYHTPRLINIPRRLEEVIVVKKNQVCLNKRTKQRQQRTEDKLNTVRLDLMCLRLLLRHGWTTYKMRHSQKISREKNKRQ
jgi:hypothetical protein